MYVYIKKNNSQKSPAICGVWGDPNVGDLTSTCNLVHRETFSNRPTHKKKILLGTKKAL